MSDLFLSYSRTDIDFVRRLDSALAARGKDVWVDWEDIPLADDWREEIEEGIEGAGAFVAVLSPEWLRSAVCARELAYAIRHEKRLIPVLRREVDDDAVPPALSTPNWVPMLEGQDEGAAVESLVRALDTDLEWVEAHTRLLVRAIEWEGAGHDASRLLRGGELRDFETRLARPPGPPRPTELQARYVRLSRDAATRRGRMVLGAVSAALVVAVALAVVALWQRQTAVTERNVAQSRELTARSVARLAVDPQESVRLAVAATRRRATDESYDALGEALLHARLRATLPKRGGRLAGLGADGRTVLTVGPQGRTRLWSWADDATAPRLTLDGQGAPATAAALSPTGDLIATGDATGALIWSATDRRAPIELPTSAAVVHTAFSRDGSALLTLGADGAARVWSVSAGRPSPVMRAGARRAVLSADGWVVVTWGGDRGAVWRAGRRVREIGDGITSAAVSPDGSRAATGSADGAIRIWATSGAAPPRVLRGHRGQVTAVDVSPDGRLVATAGIDGSARLWRTGTGAAVRVLSGRAGPLTSVAFSADGRRVVTAGDDGVARVWDARTGAARATLAGGGSNVVDARPSADGGIVATMAYDGVVRVWDAVRGASVDELAGHTASISGVAFSPAGADVLTTAFDGTARLWRGERAVAVLSGHAGAVQSGAFSPDGARVVTTGWDGTVRVWPVGVGGAPTVLRGHRGIVYAASFAPDGRRVISAGADGTARVWDVATARERPVLGAPGAPAVIAAEYDPTGGRILTAGADRVARVWDAASGRALLALRGHTDTIVAAHFSADGTRAVTASLDGTARVWDARRAAEPVVVRVPPQVVDAVLSPDGTRLATAGQDGTARTWDARTGRAERVLRGHSAPVVAVRFSPDGTMVASASEDGTSRVWGAASGRRLALLEGATEALVAVAFSPSGDRLATGGIDGVGRVFRCDRCRAMETPLRLAP